MKFRPILFIIPLIFILTISLFGQDYGFGAGIILGDPTGISLKYWSSPTNAWDAGIAWGIGKDDAFHLHSDYIWHKYGLIRVEKGRLPLYYGVGGRLLFTAKTHFGIRGVIGLDYLFAGIPLDIFLEIAPVFDLVPATEFDFTGGLGARYFF